MERKDAIEILTDMYNYYSNTDDYDSYVPFDKEDKEALEMAINSLKTDEAYQLEYELTTKNDLALIRTEGLDEEIRCTMCTNTMKSDRGCDGSCVVNKGMYKAVMDAIEKRIQPTTKNDLGVDCIVDVLGSYTDLDIPYKREIAENILTKLSSVTPQEPRKDEVILTKEEYGELVSSEFDNGYAKGYREALEQEPVLDKIRAEIWDLQYGDEEKSMTDENRADAYNNAIRQVIEIIDKYKSESENT